MRNLQLSFIIFYFDSFVELCLYSFSLLIMTEHMMCSLSTNKRWRERTDSENSYDSKNSPTLEPKSSTANSSNRKMYESIPKIEHRKFF